MNRYKLYFVNFITILRLIGIPLIFLIEKDLYLFLYANFLFLTDFFDGYLARKFGVSSTLGAVLDLLADKTLVLVILLAYTIGADARVSWLFFILIAAREIYSMIIRFNHFKKEGELINASFIGKLKTTFQFLALNMVIFNIWGYNLALGVVIILSYYSFLGYFKKSRGEDNE